MTGEKIAVICVSSDHCSPLQEQVFFVRKHLFWDEISSIKMNTANKYNIIFIYAVGLRH